MQLIRSLLLLAFIAGLAWCGATVPLGERTFFGHVERIWKSDEAQGLVDGVKESSGPMIERVKRGVAAGLEEASKDAGQ